MEEGSFFFDGAIRTFGRDTFFLSSSDNPLALRQSRFRSSKASLSSGVVGR